MEEQEGNKPLRRMFRSSRRGGLSQSTVSEGVGSVVAEAAPEDPDLNAMTEAAAAASAQPRPTAPRASTPQDAEVSVPTSADEEYTPISRIRQVGRRSSEYEREYRLQLLHRLLMRRVPIDEIATQLEISVSQVLKDRQELYERLREESRKLDIDQIVGHNKGFYEEVAAMSLRAASHNGTPMPLRLAAMRTALAAQNDSHRFMQAAGVFDVLRYRRAGTEAEMNDVQRMMAMTRELLDAETNPLDGATGDDSADQEHIEL